MATFGHIVIGFIVLGVLIVAIKHGVADAKENKSGSVKVVRASGDRMAELMISKYTRQGYELQSHNVRKATWAATTGLFTRKQIHTLTFVKPS